MFEICNLQQIKKIVKLANLKIGELRKLNIELERAYTGKELTKEQLIYQIVFLRDSPNV